MRSRFIVVCAAKAVGMTRAIPASSMRTSSSVAMASISGTIRCGRSFSTSGAQGLGVGHVDDVGPVGDLLAGRIGVAVDRDGLDAQALEFDHHFLAEFARAQKHDAGGLRRERGTEAHSESSGL